VVFTYSLVGADRKVLPQIEHQLAVLKADLCPGLAPESWHLHMKVLWSGKKRNEDPALRGLDSRVVATRLALLLKELDKSILVYNVARVVRAPSHGPRGKTGTIEAARDDAYLALVMKVISDITKQGGQPGCTSMPASRSRMATGSFTPGLGMHSKVPITAFSTHGCPTVSRFLSPSSCALRRTPARSWPTS
jgi:hypothetical protein